MTVYLPQPLPPECQSHPELGQLTDPVREERDRAQSLCTTLVDNAAYYGGYPKYGAMYNYLPYNYMAFDGGGVSPVEEIMTHYMCTVQLCLQPT